MKSDSYPMGKVRLAVQRLAAAYPLHAGIIARWEIEESTETRTIGVGFRAGKLRLVFDPDFVKSITMSELEGVLHHEANHVLFGHVLHVPAPDENTEARTIAQEVTVNEWVGEPLPAGVIGLGDFPFLPRNEDTERRYKRLCKKMKSVSADLSRSAKRQSRGGGASPCEKDPESGGVKTVDDHTLWGEIREHEEEASVAIDMDCAAAWGDMTPDKRAEVDEAIGQAIQNILERQGMSECGSGTDGDQEDIGAGVATIPWQQVLRRKVKNALPKNRPVLNRPPRRYPHLIGIVPGKARRAADPHVVAAIDTSGSMSAEMLAVISAELAMMARRFTVTVVECDEEIHAVYPFRPIHSVIGRGGTDLRPPLKSDFLKDLKASLVVYFTDGCGPAPSEPPPVPVIWAITEGGTKPTSWGDEIRLKEP